MSILFLDGNNIDDVEVEQLTRGSLLTASTRPSIKCNPNKLACCRMANFPRIDSILHGVVVAKWNCQDGMKKFKSVFSAWINYCT